jgi:hypothetical protein
MPRRAIGDIASFHRHRHGSSPIRRCSVSCSAPSAKIQRLERRSIRRANVHTRFCKKLSPLSPDGKADAAECLRLWALVHGIAKLVLEGCVRPADFGLADGEALAAHLLRRP